MCWDSCGNLCLPQVCKNRAWRGFWGTMKLFVGGQMRVGIAQHYHFRAVIRGCLAGRSTKIKWLLLQHLIRKEPLSLSLQLILEWGEQGKSSTQPCATTSRSPWGSSSHTPLLSCSSALGSTDGHRGTSLPDALALPKPFKISWECKDQSCTKPSRFGCKVALERGRNVF